MAFVLSHAQDSHEAFRVSAGTSLPIDIERGGLRLACLLLSALDSIPTTKSKLRLHYLQILSQLTIVVRGTAEPASQPDRYTGVRLSLEGI